MGQLTRVLLMCLLLASDCYSQDAMSQYNKNIHIADSFFVRKEYFNAGTFYNKAFEGGISSDYHRLIAAESWAKCYQNDSALMNLYVLIYQMNFSDFDEFNKRFIGTDLKSQGEFNKLIQHCLCVSKVKERKYNPVLANLLDSIFVVDQAGRSLQNTMINRTEAVVSENSQNKNLKFIDSIYNSYGWLSSTEVGYRGSLAQFLVIQHSTLSELKKRKAIVKKAVNDCLLAPENYALLVDRILIFSGRKQLYGTQVHFNDKTKKYEPYPIQHPNFVKKRRIRFGMISLEKYLAEFNSPSRVK